MSRNKNHKNLLVKVYCNVGEVCRFSLADWDLLLRQARRADLLPRLSFLLEEAELFDKIPSQVVPHLKSAQLLANGHKRAVRWEVNRICQALKLKGIPVVLLKGSAYLMSDLPISAGRTFADIDLLVERQALGDAERALLLGGWVGSHHDSYDQRYYREWMHELPPLKHIKRRSVLDVHHTILPLTASLKPDSSKLFANIVSLPDNPDIFTLSPIDMVLHSATHLFHEGEFEHAFRGLTDLDGLLRHFSDESEAFWRQLVQRAAELDLKVPLFYALRYTQTILDTPVPEGVIGRLGDDVPKGLKAMLMDFLFLRALQPYHYSCDIFASSLARWLLFVRSHYLRMPFKLLIPHLIRKALKSRQES